MLAVLSRTTASSFAVQSWGAALHESCPYDQFVRRGLFTVLSTQQQQWILHAAIDFACIQVLVPECVVEKAYQEL
jgi:hypothetical protein